MRLFRKYGLFKGQGVQAELVDVFICDLYKFPINWDKMPEGHYVLLI